MANPERSVSREIKPHDIRRYSSFADLLNLTIKEGKVKDLDDLLKNHPTRLGAILFDWYKQGQIACIFAQRIARRRELRVNWESYVINGEVNPNQVEADLLKAADRFEAVQLIFPGLETAHHAVDLIKALCKHPSWSCYEVDWMPDERGRSLQVGLRWYPKGFSYQAWVLAIAPFEPMPFTRRFEGAPFIALVLRAAPPSTFNPTPKENDVDASHLAHMNDGLEDDEDKRKRTDRETRKAKQLLLGADLRSTARAKVTFALPLWCRDLLGDALIPIKASWFRKFVTKPLESGYRELKSAFKKGRN
jgi:hypothetical protein